MKDKDCLYIVGRIIQGKEDDSIDVSYLAFVDIEYDNELYDLYIADERWRENKEDAMPFYCERDVDFVVDKLTAALDDEDDISYNIIKIQ